MVDLILDDKELDRVINKIIGRFAFLLQKEMIERLPGSFANKINVVKEGVAWIVGSNDEILRYYILGTKPHIIKPRNKKALAFGWPKSPISPNSPTGNFVFKSVKHPGTKAHNVIEDIEQDKNLLMKLLDRAINQSTK